MKPSITLVSLLLFGMAACTDDVTPAAPVQTNNQTEPPGPDPEPPREEPPVTNPQIFPKYLLVNMEPGRTVYAVGNALLPNVQLLDEDQNPITNPAFTVEVEPAGAARRNNNGRWELLTEGLVRFLVCAERRNRDGEAVCGWDRVLVDNAPPTITITRPLPGAQLDATNNPRIEVLGTVAESHGTPIVFVNGEEVPVQGGTFVAYVEPRFGINHIEVAATDQINPNTSVTGVDVIWAPRYEAPLADIPGVELNPGIALWLGQNFMDDRRAAPRLPDGTRTTDDLVDILQLILEFLDLSAQIPNPVIDASGFTLSVPDIDIGKPTVVANIVSGGVEIYIQLRDVEALTQGGFELEGQVLNLNGRIYSTISALIRLNISKASPNAPLVVDVDNIILAVESASSEFASPEANAIFTLAQSVLRTTIEDLLVDVLNDSFVSELPALLQDTLGGLDSALRDQSIDLDLGFGNPITLNFDAGISSIVTRYRHSLYAPMRARASVEGTRFQPNSRGIPLLTASPSDPFFHASRMQIGLRLGLLNGLLHALWDAGLLELDVSEQLPLQVDQALASAKIQPLIRPPLEGQDGTFVIQLGQFELTLSLLGTTDVFGLNLSMPVTFGIVNDAIGLTFDGDPVVNAWLISSGRERPLIAPDQLRDIFITQVFPGLLSSLGQGLSFPLPVPDLSGLGSVSPPLGAFSVSFDLYRRIDIRNEWIVLDMSLEGRL